MSLFGNVLNGLLVNGPTTSTPVTLLNILETLNQWNGGGGDVAASISLSPANTGGLFDVAVTSDGQTAYIADPTENAVYFLNTKTYQSGRLSGATFSSPSFIAISPDGTKVCIVNNPVTNTISVNIFSTSTNTFLTSGSTTTGTSPLTAQNVVCDNNQVYISYIDNLGVGRIAYMPLNGSSLSTIPSNGIGGSTLPYIIGIAPNNSLLYIIDDLNTQASVYSFNIFPFGAPTLNTHGPLASSGLFPFGTSSKLAIGSSYAYFAGGGSSIGVVNLSTLAITAASVNPNTAAYSVALAPSGNLLYATAGASQNRISVVNTSSFPPTLSTTITTNTPANTAIAIPTGTASNTTGTVSNVSGLSGTITSTYSSGGSVTASVTNTTGSTIYVTLALYRVESALGFSNGTQNWVNTQTLLNSQTFTVPNSASPQTLTVTNFTYPSGAFQLDFYQGSDPINWANAPVNGIVPLNLLDAQFKYP